MDRALHDVFARIHELEPLPVVATRVLALATRDDVVPGELCAVIRTDAALTTRVLKLSNSAYYGFRREIASLEEAGVCLGVTRLASLVLTSCTGRWFHENAGSDPELARRTWKRNVANALGARALAQIAGTGAEGEVDRAYTAGLLQNLGESVLDRWFAAERSEILSTHVCGHELLVAERAAFGGDHAEIGARLVEQWGLPERLVEAIRWHHEPERASREPELAAIVHLGEQVALACEGSLPVESLEEDPSLAIAAVDIEILVALAQSLAKEIERAHDLVAV